MFLPILGVLAAGCAGGAALAVFTDAATVVSGWFGDFVGGLFGAPPLPHRKVTLGGVLGDALGGCALGAASAGLLELITLLRPAAELPLGEAGGSSIDAAKLSLTKTVANEAGSRPYVNSPRMIQWIMDSGTPRADPGGIPGGLRWDVPGWYNGSQGTWQLVVDPSNMRIVHMLFTTK